jgi:DNA-binding NarL/FixJ family response regulator
VRIVVIEDNEDVALYLETFLIQEGHEPVVVTGHFDQVLHEDFWWGIDVAIVDLLLNYEVNGGHILSWLLEHQPRIRRVVLSAVANHVDVKELAHAVLVKPASAVAIRRALAGGGMDGE